MKTKLSLLLLIFSMSVALSQGTGEIIPPSMPFPESIFEGKSGTIILTYNVNNKGIIISFGIAQIRIVQKSKKASSGYETKPIYVDSTFMRYPYNIKSKIGLKYYNKLKPWLKKFGENSKFVESKNSDIDEIKNNETFRMSYSITFGDLWPVGDRHKFPKY